MMEYFFWLQKKKKGKLTPGLMPTEEITFAVGLLTCKDRIMCK